MNTYFPVLLENLSRPDENIVEYLLKIIPDFEYSLDSIESMENYVRSIQSILRRVIPGNLIEYARSIDSIDDHAKIAEFYRQLNNQGPLAQWSKTEDPNGPYTFSIAIVCRGERTHGVGRFLSDVFSQWLIPGKQLPLLFVQSFVFRFTQHVESQYLIHEVFVGCDNLKDLQFCQQHIEDLLREIRLIILAVQHSRKVIALRELTLDQKKMIIHENITSLLKLPGEHRDHTIFQQMHHFLIKVSAEAKITQVKEQIAPLLEYKPQIFERDIFAELQRFTFLIRDDFIAQHDMLHITRVISYTYLFRKIISLSNPGQRHVLVRIMRTTIHTEHGEKRILGILTAINLYRENEIFEEKHVIKAIETCLPHARKVAGSTISDTRINSNVRTIYIEITSETNEPFTAEDLNILRADLHKELKTSRVVNPLFMPRNEEEIMRTIVTLSKQLKYVQDIPQINISFHKQTDTSIAFTVILVRILNKDAIDLRNTLEQSNVLINFSELETKSIGLLRKKYPKEANVFEAIVDKRQFLRKDYSVDLSQARNYVIAQLTQLLGDLRDYNGGMISKQTEVLHELKKLLLQIEIQDDFLLENFFYSLSPKYMQGIIKPFILKEQFIMLLEALEYSYLDQPYFLKTHIVDNYYLIMLGAINPTIKDFTESAIEKLDLDTSKLTTFYVNEHDISCLGFLLRFEENGEHLPLIQAIMQRVREWRIKIPTNQPANFLPTALELEGADPLHV